MEYVYYFVYDGYYGNANNFYTHYICEQQCSGQLILYEGRYIIDFSFSISKDSQK